MKIYQILSVEVLKVGSCNEGVEASFHWYLIIQIRGLELPSGGC